MEVAMPLDTAIHGDSEPFIIIQQQEQPVATTSTQDQPSEFSQDFYAQRARRVQPQRQRHGRFGTHSLDEFIQKHIEREAQQRSVIPPDTLLFCSTDSSLVPNAEDIVNKIDARFGLSKELPETTEEADDFDSTSYFRSREVMHKIRRQQIIETPSFSEITDEDRLQAYHAIPPEMMGSQVDRSDDAYYVIHAVPLKKEQRVRVSETDKFRYRKHQLRDRIRQLNGMDASYFRGETQEEQERDRVIVLTAGNEILEQIDGKQDEESEEDYEDMDGQPGVNGVHSSKKRKAPTTQEEEVDESGLLPHPVAPKPEKKKRKESSRLYHPADYGLEDIINGNPNPYVDDEIDLPKKSKKKKNPSAGPKKGANLGKRKRVEQSDVDMDMDIEPEVDIYVEEGEYHGYDTTPLIPPAPPKKKKSKPSAHPRMTSGSLPPTLPIKNEKLSKLLDQARKYNPDRVSRDLNPFGAAFDSRILSHADLDFQLPRCVVGNEEGDEDDDDDDLDDDLDDTTETMQEHEAEENDQGEQEEGVTMSGAPSRLGERAETTESVRTEDAEGEEEVAQNIPSSKQNANDSSSALSEPEDDDEDDDGEPEP